MLVKGVPGRSWKHTFQCLLKTMILMSLINFIAWFMICLITLLNNSGYDVPRGVIISSMLVIPENAVLNPLIHRLSSAETRRAWWGPKTVSLRSVASYDTKSTSYVTNWTRVVATVTTIFFISFLVVVELRGIHFNSPVSWYLPRFY